MRKGGRKSKEEERKKESKEERDDEEVGNREMEGAREREERESGTRGRKKRMNRRLGLWKPIREIEDCPDGERKAAVQKEQWIPSTKCK